MKLVVTSFSYLDVTSAPYWALLIERLLRHFFAAEDDGVARARISPRSCYTAGSDRQAAVSLPPPR